MPDGVYQNKNTFLLANSHRMVPCFDARPYYDLYALSIIVFETMFPNEDLLHKMYFRKPVDPSEVEAVIKNTRVHPRIWPFYNNLFKARY